MPKIDPRLANGRVAYPYQVKDAERILDKKRMIAAHNVGLGKTTIANLVGREYKRRATNKVVVIAPPTLIDNWKRESTGNVDLELYSSGKIPDKIDGKYFLVADEAHAYQDIDSKRTQQMMRLADRADGVLLMTATPIRNYPYNLFPLLKMLQHDVAKSETYYRYFYCDDSDTGSSHGKHLHKKTKDAMIVREKEGHLHLPSFTRKTVTTELGDAGKRLFDDAFNKARKQYQDRVKEGIISDYAFYIVLINNLREASAIGKVDKTTELAKRELKKGHQVTIFCNFLKSINLIASELQGYGVSLITGETANRQRQRQADAFQSGTNRVFIGSMKAAGIGLNLFKGSVNILNSRSWSPFDAVQAEGRIHRNGQQNDCLSLWVQDKIVDPYIDSMQLAKYRIARGILHGEYEDMNGVQAPGEVAEHLSKMLFTYGG